MKPKSRSYGVNVGSSSILLIFVILCLVCFATLSIVSAQADYRLSAKLAERTTAYYSACNDAEAYLQDLQASLESIYETTDTKDAYFAAAGHELTFSKPLSDQQVLEVHLDVLYPDDAENVFYKVKTWQVVTLDTLELDDTLPVFQTIMD